MTAEQVVRLHYQYFNERRFDDAVRLIGASQPPPCRSLTALPGKNRHF
jgi:hypothetical protein